MTKTVILDTNVLYDIGLDRIRIEDLRRPGELLCYSPISVIELVSKLDDRSFEDRKVAAGVILRHRLEELPDPESFLTGTFGYKLAEPPPSYADAVQALAEGQSLEEVRSGVPDYEIRVRRCLNVPFAATWREKGEQEWVDSLISLMKDNIPGFQKWYVRDLEKRPSSVPKLRGAEKEKFFNGMKSREWFAQVISACQARAFFKADKNDLGVFTKKRAHELAAAVPQIECYALMYTYYLIRLMTEGLLPKKNDSGDIDFFLYSMDDSQVVATNDKKWIAIADVAGFTHRIRRYGYGLSEAASADNRNCLEEAAKYCLKRDAARYGKMDSGDYAEIHQEETAEKYGRMDFEGYIEIRPGVRSGKPCFKDTRITVDDVLEYLAGGMTEAELLADFPILTTQHIRAAWAFSDAHKLGFATGSKS